VNDQGQYTSPSYKGTRFEMEHCIMQGTE